MLPHVVHLVAWPSGNSSGFTASLFWLAAKDPLAPILLLLVLIVLGAAFAGHLMRRWGQPAVLGELLFGVLAGNAGYWFGQPLLTVFRYGETVRKITETALLRNVTLDQAVRVVLPAGPQTDRLAGALSGTAGVVAVGAYEFLDLLSRIAVIVLLFLVGLEMSVGEMRRVGMPALRVAVFGVIAPFLLGLGTILVWMPQEQISKALFIGGILTATSIGITARVLRDLGQDKRSEARIILGAAVIDDVLGLLVLAIVSALVTRGAIQWLTVAGITLKSVAFLVGSIAAGLWLTPRLVRRFARLQLANAKVLLGLGFAFVLAWLANLVGMATIIGAFAAGLVLEEVFLKELQQERSLHDLLAPVESLIVPVFFVLMGMQVQLETFTQASVLLLAAALTAAAILGKVVAGLGAGRGLNRIAIGFGMMPRGEVGLIFAGIGQGLGVVSESLFSAVVLMVMVTTFLTPPLLRLTLVGRRSR